MSLVEHAQKELELAGNDKAFNDCIINAVREFAKYGHSGGSATVGIHILNDLLQFKNLTPLNDDPKHWMLVTEGSTGKYGPCWQSTRNPEAFSQDGGQTYYLLSEGGNQENPGLIHKSEKKS
jgi:hypothetical protein